jgi:hypothetical protein
MLNLTLIETSTTIHGKSLRCLRIGCSTKCRQGHSCRHFIVRWIVALAQFA